MSDEYYSQDACIQNQSCRVGKPNLSVISPLLSKDILDGVPPPSTKRDLQYQA